MQTIPEQARTLHNLADDVDRRQAHTRQLDAKASRIVLERLNNGHRLGQSTTLVIGMWMLLEYLGNEIVGMRWHIQIRLPVLDGALRTSGGIEVILKPLMGRAGAALLEAGDLHHIVEDGAQCVGRLRVGGLQAAPEAGIAIAMGAREGATIAESTPAIAHVEHIGAHVVLATAAILACMWSQIIVAGGGGAGATPLGARINEAQTAAELVAIGALTATHLLQFHNRLARHLANATGIRLEQHALNVATVEEEKGKHQMSLSLLKISRVAAALTHRSVCILQKG